MFIEEFIGVFSGGSTERVIVKIVGGQSDGNRRGHLGRPLICGAQLGSHWCMMGGGHWGFVQEKFQKPYRHTDKFICVGIHVSAAFEKIAEEEAQTEDERQFWNQQAEKWRAVGTCLRTFPPQPEGHVGGGIGSIILGLSNQWCPNTAFQTW